MGTAKAHEPHSQTARKKGVARQPSPEAVVGRVAVPSAAAIEASPRSILAVQRLAGNRAALHLLGGSGTKDPSEDPSGRVADPVVAATPAAPTATTREQQGGGLPTVHPAADPGVVQRLKVEDDHVRGDLRHPKGKTLFEDYTWDDIEGRAGGPIHTVSNVTLDAAVNASRQDEMMDYKQLSQRKVSSEKQLLAYMNESPDDEHMYVLDDDDLHVAIRAETKKLPHPTLVGGDPDVECAGTMRMDLDGNVVVTASSGHFRPSTERKGQVAVDKIMNKTAPTKYKKQVKGSRR